MPYPEGGKHTDINTIPENMPRFLVYAECSFKPFRLRWVERFLFSGGKDMETRIAHIGIIVENTESAEKINRILHEAGDYVVGRMGIPYREKGVSVISVVVDAPESVTAAVSGKLGMLEGVTAKTVYAKV